MSHYEHLNKLIEEARKESMYAYAKIIKFNKQLGEIEKNVKFLEDEVSEQEALEILRAYEMALTVYIIQSRKTRGES